jgi:hypothetical protein
VNERYATTAKAAEKMLADLKAATRAERSAGTDAADKPAKPA